MTDIHPTATLAQLRAGQLIGATRLDLRGCGLDEVPPEVFALADTLETLDLSGNALQSLPDAFASLQRLRILFCSDNHFSTLPAVLGRCAALDIIGFKANQIAQVPAQAVRRWIVVVAPAIVAEVRHSAEPRQAKVAVPVKRAPRPSHGAQRTLPSARTVSIAPAVSSAATSARPTSAAWVARSRSRPVPRMVR